MKIRAFPAPSGSATWRLHDPFKYMRKTGIDAQVVTEGGITDEVCKEADVLVVQSIVDKTMIGRALWFRENKNLKIVYEIDDYWKANDYNINIKSHQVTGFADITEDMLMLSDMVTTTSEHLASLIYPHNKNVRILPNAMDFDRWKVKYTHKNTSSRIRIGWAGSLTHTEDLKLAVPALKRIMNEFPQVELVLVGDMRMRAMFSDTPRVEVMLGVPMEAWPHKLHGLRLDIGIAPLLNNEFNKCKSNIKWQEYTVAGIPGVYSPTVYRHGYFEEKKMGLVADNSDGWYINLRNLIICPYLREEIVESASVFLERQYNLEYTAKNWVEAYTSLLN